MTTHQMDKRALTIKDRIDELIRTINRDEISIDTVKSFWRDKYGQRHLPSSTMISARLRISNEWIPSQRERDRTYFRR
jgi:hypothetical protein